MKAKTWLRAALGLTLGVLLAVALLTAAVDPLFHFHGPLPGIAYPLDAERYTNDGITRHFSYDAVITGTSVSANFRASQLDALFGCHSIKTVYPAGSYCEIDLALRRTLARNGAVTLVIRSLDFDREQYLLETPEELAAGIYPAYLYNDEPWDDVRYLLNKDILLKYTAYALFNTLRGGESTSMDAYSNWTAGKRFGAEAVLAGYPAAPAAPEQPGLTEAERAVLRESLERTVLATVRAHPETSFYLFFPPYSICAWDQMAQEGKLEKSLALQELILDALLPCENVRIFGFSADFETVCDLSLYMDTAHYSEAVSALLLERMQKGDYLVTKDNEAAYLEAIRAFYGGFDYASLRAGA